MTPESLIPSLDVLKPTRFLHLSVLKPWQIPALKRFEAQLIPLAALKPQLIPALRRFEAPVDCCP